MAKVLSNFPKAHAGEDSGEYYNSGSSPSGHSVKRTALHARTAAFTKPRFLIWQHTNSVFLHSRKRLLPLTDAPRVFSYDSFHCIFTDQLNTFSKAGSSTSRTHASLTIIEWRWVSCEESCRSKQELLLSSEPQPSAISSSHSPELFRHFLEFCANSHSGNS